MTENRNMILAIVLIVVTGLGTQAGTLALALGGVGLLGKLIADSFEEVSAGPERALAATGATRLQVAATCLGRAERALEHAKQWAVDRHQFGQQIGKFQGVSFKLADMAMELEAARQLVYVAAAKSQRSDPDLAFFGAAAKCFASDVAMKVTTDAVQLLGGAGYTRDFPLERMMRDAKITQIYEGTNQVQRIVMARQLLSAGLSG